MEQIGFNGVQIPVVVSEGRQWVSVRHVCQALGIDPDSQRVKLKQTTEYQRGDITVLDNQGRQFPMFCIAAEHAHLWIAGISAAKVREDIREQFIAFKHECANVIYNHFLNKGQDFLGLAQELRAFRTEVNAKLDDLVGVAQTVFGDDKDEIEGLVKDVAALYKVDGRTVWGWVQTEVDVHSYKSQNRKVINFLRNKLGKGLNIVKGES